MQRFILLLVFVPASFFIPAKAQNASTNAKYGRPDSLINLQLASKVKATIVNFSGSVNDEGMDEFTYTVAVVNKNNEAIVITLGGLVYGHYKGCIAKQKNFVK
jgi:hypothetical protein